MNVKEIDNIYDFRHINLRWLLKSGLKILYKKIRYLLPVVIIYYGISYYIEYQILIKLMKNGEFYSLSSIIIRFIVSVLNLYYSAYIILFIKNDNDKYFIFDYIRIITKKLWDIIITIVAMMIKGLPYILIGTATVTIFSIITVLSGYSVNNTILLNVIMIPVFIIIFYVLIRFYFSIANVLIREEKGFTAVNMSILVFKNNRKIMLLYSIPFIILPTLITFLYFYFQSTLILNILGSIITIVIGLLSSTYKALVITNYIDEKQIKKTPLENNNITTTWS